MEASVHYKRLAAQGRRMKVKSSCQLADSRKFFIDSSGNRRQLPLPATLSENPLRSVP
jgi:hypothetical protein